jgi:hypothetical protein
MGIKQRKQGRAGQKKGEQMNCYRCGEDIEAKGQDNVSSVCDKPLCEDCIGDNNTDDLSDDEYFGK